MKKFMKFEPKKKGCPSGPKPLKPRIAGPVTSVGKLYTCYETAF